MTKNIAVLGSQWGDCGKGHLTHTFSSTTDADFVIRFNGGGNSGHTIYRNGKKYIHHQLPSADYTKPYINSFIAAGTVINLPKLLDELLIMEADFPGVGKTIYIDPDAFIVSSEHITADKQNNKELGTTAQGIGPAYTDKVGRKGKRVFEFLDTSQYNECSKVIKQLQLLGVHFTSELALRETFKRSNLVFEGAQSVLLDLNVGLTYPYCTSSDCTVSGIYSSGFHWVELDRVYGIMKPYITKSGNGPLPTEDNNEWSKNIRQLGKEIGATTGRDRRIGYLDLPSLKYAVLKGGLTHLIITKLDILNGQKTIKVCHRYNKEIHSPADFRDIKPEYIEIPGWTDARDSGQIKPFLSMVEEFIGLPVEYVSCGVNKEDLIKVR